MESPSDPKREAKSHFAQSISDRLTDELSENKFDRLIVIAPPVMLGDLRKKFSKKLRSSIIGEVHKDLTHLHSDDILAHIEDFLVT